MKLRITYETLIRQFDAITIIFANQNHGSRYIQQAKILVQVIGNGVSWMNDKVIKPMTSITNALLQFLGPVGNDISCCGRYLGIKEISDVHAPQTSSPYAMPVGFTVSIPMDDLLIFSAFSEYPNNELLSSGQNKLKDTDLFFRNWFLTFQYTNMYTQIECTADLITGIRAEELIPSGLNNLVCDIKPVTVSVRNYIKETITTNICGYRASETCPNCVRQFYQNSPFVVPAQLIESWVFPSAASQAGIKTAQNIPLSHITNMCILFPNDAGRNFPDFPMNALNEQSFTMQLQANILVNIFEACDQYKNSLATPRANKTRRYNAVSDYTSFLITIQYERNSNGALTFDELDSKIQNIPVELKGHPIFAGDIETYNNVDTNGKHPPPPILCTVHDTFWLFTPADGGSCVYDIIHSFDQIDELITD
ncbi:MAG: hypothetical protein EZS28_001174 [Streblomastix strix]|uniref:Uncharacterized protein n=1 Tax=Streblomastix strix TaxID=222440 RepID=A0A5J4X8U6_9EUKA|nr:MAG: hypothetical protein EZS28_001174 [Streblomastix strix]